MFVCVRAFVCVRELVGCNKNNIKMHITCIKINTPMLLVFGTGVFLTEAPTSIPTPDTDYSEVRVLLSCYRNFKKAT
jgi:hypothetical protein